MNRREAIQMSQDEVLAFLAEEKTVICATNGRSGFPHLMPLWFVVRDGEIWAWTFAKSQKVKNLERDNRASLQVEAGTDYPELRGVMIESEVQVYTDFDTVRELGTDVFKRYAMGGAEGDLPEPVQAMVDKQATKRVAMHFVEKRRVSWDHRKLPAGVY